MWQIWLIASGIFFICEIITVGFLVFWLGVGALIAIIGLYAKIPEPVSTIFVLAGYAILLYRTAKNAVYLLFKSKTINENLLITMLFQLMFIL